MNPPPKPLPAAGREAVVRYDTPDFHVLQPGDFVRCAVSGKPIPLLRNYAPVLPGHAWSGTVTGSGPGRV